MQSQQPILFDTPAPAAPRQAGRNTIRIKRSQLRRLVAGRQRQLYRDYAAACCRGRRHRKIECVETVPLPLGHVIHATDCDYIVEPAGNWRRIEKTGPHLPPGKTNIYLRDPNLIAERKPLAGAKAPAGRSEAVGNDRPRALA